jgi:hypothetical protein
MGLYEEVGTFRKYDRVVITGPQRSGTHIAAKVVADILGWPDIEENYITMGQHDRRNKRGDHDENYFRWVSEPKKKHTVLQCPQISHACHKTPKGVLVVFMLRDVEEIISSDKHRIAKYKQGPWAGPSRWGTPVQSVFNSKAKQYSKRFYGNAPIDKWDTPAAVYDVWHNTQKAFDFDYYELDYNLLKEHKLWLPLEVRREKFTKGTDTCL